MSDPGHLPATHQPVEDDRDPDIPLWLILALVAVLLAGSGVAAFALLSGDKEENGPSYPKVWDARVAPFVKIVEKKRGLTFLHPVEVRFLEDKAFEKEVTTEEKDLDKEEREEIEQFTGLMRALGLITGDVDLFEAFNDVSGTGTLAYYSPEDEQITVRGAKLTPAARATLVHELTHALQDQHFQIGDRSEKLREDLDDGASTTEYTVFDALIEGDAERVATLYRESLTPKQRKALDAGTESDVDKANKELKHVPKVVLTMVSSPYALGEALVQAVAADGGNAAIDKLFRDPPAHEAVLLDPFQVLTGDLDATEVDVPDLEDGAEEFDKGEFGVLTWYFMLAERLPLLDALAAADGWGGDAYVAFERGEDTCARIAYAGDTGQDTARMHRALQRWIAAAPGSPAEVSRDGDVVRFESCDPGTASKVGQEASVKALELAAVRTYLGLGIVKSGAPEGLARCLAGRLVREYPLSSLTDPQFGSGDPAVENRVRQLAIACR